MSASVGPDLPSHLTAAGEPAERVDGEPLRGGLEFPADIISVSRMKSRARAFCRLSLLALGAASTSCYADWGGSGLPRAEKRGERHRTAPGLPDRRLYNVAIELPVVGGDCP